MKSFYLYVQAGAIMDGTARMYKIGIGSSAADSKLCAQLASYAAHHGHWFEKWSPATADFVLKVRQHYTAVLPLMYAKPRALLASLRDGNALPIPDALLHNHHHLLFSLSCDYRSSSSVSLNFSASSHLPSPSTY